MNRTAAVILLWLSSCITLGSSAHGETGITIRGAVTREMTDFDTGATSDVIKAGLSFSVDDVYRFNCSYMRDRDTGNDTLSWFILSEPGNSFYTVVAGNYSLHFGSGLVMGKKEYMAGDPFSRKLSFTRDDVFTPSVSANPACSFFGAAAGIVYKTDFAGIGITPFYSVQRRYIKEEEVYENRIGSTIATLNMKYSPDGLNRSPVDIVNAGCLLNATLAQLFQLQLYGFSTGVDSACGESIRWECRDDDSPGTESVSSYGLFAGYMDENISIFAEPALTLRSGPGWSKSGMCIAWGMSLRNELFNMRFSGKNSDRAFRSIYSTGDSGPEDVLELSGAFDLMEHLETGAAFYSEKDITAVPGSGELKCFMREEAVASVKKFENFGAELKFSRRVPLDGDDKTNTRQCSSAVNIAAGKTFFLRGKFTGQYNRDGDSYLCTAEAKLMLFTYYSLAAGCTYARPDKDNPVYAALIPAAENTMDINRFVSNTSGYAIKLRYSCAPDSLYFRFSSLKTGGDREYNWESGLVLVF